MKILLLVLALGLVSCSKKDEWTLFYYPDVAKMPPATEAHNYDAGKFNSFESCQETGARLVRSELLETKIQAAYECGYKCQKQADLGILVCEETKK
ncbi:hypothetical protein [Chitinilyticum piscinae]|uniref:Lipoprotein n=1 Tax=Chitinilyticum piscinae TaxID=2866724 RepID=A0A8J7FP19_9NEIS|nr:hypothetical protein [Chitinilyticum piscinae]MBE9607881.1 hypothetical protein [Chitinilyticum piscinae]